MVQTFTPATTPPGCRAEEEGEGLGDGAKWIGGGKNPLPLAPLIPTVDGRNPNHQLIGGKHPIIYRVSTGAEFRNHPQ